MLKLSIHTKSKIQQHIRRRHSECCCLNDKCPPQDHIFEHLVPFGEKLWNFRGQVLAGGPISLGTVFLHTETLITVFNGESLEASPLRLRTRMLCIYSTRSPSQSKEVIKIYQRHSNWKTRWSVLTRCETTFKAGIQTSKIEERTQK